MAIAKLVGHASEAAAAAPTLSCHANRSILSRGITKRWHSFAPSRFGLECANAFKRSHSAEIERLPGLLPPRFGEEFPGLFLQLGEVVCGRLQAQPALLVQDLTGGPKLFEGCAIGYGPNRTVLEQAIEVVVSQATPLWTLDPATKDAMKNKFWNTTDVHLCSLRAAGKPFRELQMTRLHRDLLEFLAREVPDVLYPMESIWGDTSGLSLRVPLVSTKRISLNGSKSGSFGIPDLMGFNWTQEDKLLSSAYSRIHALFQLLCYITARAINEDADFAHLAVVRAGWHVDFFYSARAGRGVDGSWAFKHVGHHEAFHKIQDPGRLVINISDFGIDGLSLNTDLVWKQSVLTAGAAELKKQLSYPGNWSRGGTPRPTILR